MRRKRFCFSSPHLLISSSPHRSFISLISIVGILSVLLTGCGLSLSREPVIKPASIPPLADMTPYRDKVKEAEEVVSEPLPELPITQAEGLPKEFFDFTTGDEELELQTVLAAIVMDTGYNLVVEPEVSGKVKVTLKDVTLEQLLDIILRPLSIEYKIEGNFLKIFKPKVETKIFTLNYVAVTRGGGGGGAGGAAAGGGAAVGGGGGGGGASAQIWQELQTQLDTFKSADGKVVIQQSTNSIIVTDYPANLKNIEEFIKNAEAILRRQVSIQAQIIQITLSDDYQMGIDWNLFSRLSPLKLKGATTGGKVVSQRLGSGTNVFQFGVIDGDFSLLLDLMKRQGQVEILSKPQISVLNNQPALIRAGTNDIFWKTTTEIEPETGRRTQTSAPQTITIGIVLNVIPQISLDGSMTMHIQPSITDKVGESQSPLGDKAPILIVQETDTIIKVNDGQTIMIAGLMQDRKSRNVTYVPFFHRLPFIGKVFRTTTENKQKSELVIFLTPTILDLPKPETLSYGNQ